MKSMHSREELKSLYSGNPTSDNMEGYVYITLLPKLAEMSKEGKLVVNNKDNQVSVLGDLWQYKGDYDREGNMAGWGVASANGNTLYGTFLDNQLEGMIRTYYDK